MAKFRSVLPRAALLLVIGPLLALSGCAELMRDSGDARKFFETEDDVIRKRILEVPMYRAADKKPTAGKGTEEGPSRKAAESRPKSGPTYFSGQAPLINRDANIRGEAEMDGDGTVTFNFIDTAIAEVVRTILGDLLGVTYVIDAKVQGTITAQSKKGLPQDVVIAVLSDLLSANGAALIYENGIYRVVPGDKARRGTSPPRLAYLADDFDPAFAIQVVPLQFVAAEEMAKVMRSLGPGDTVLNIDKARNILVLGGNGAELSKMLELVDLFDVDWLAGTSFALYQLEVADAATVIEELEPIFGEGAGTPIAGLVRFMPIPRLNTVLAMSPRSKALRDAMDWVRRLDREAASSERGLHVYYVQNGRAENLAGILQQIFDTPITRRGSNLAPGRRPVRIASSSNRLAKSGSGGSGQSNLGANRSSPTSTGADRGSGQTTTGQARGSRSGATTGAGTNRGARTQSQAVAAGNGEQIKIIADDANNALVIMATLNEYRRIETALRKLDIEPLQVVIEATIAEVTLNDELRYGVQWFFQQGNLDFSLSQVASGAAASIFPGFSAVYQGSADTRAVINALASVTDVNVISSPQLMVLNNQTATLRVGDQVPVATQSAVTTTDPDAPIVNTIEFRDTGVILQVTPRVNANGLVTIDIVQEVSDVIATTTSGIDSPTIQQRSIETTVAVQSGETIILGGLIRETKGITKSGIPILKDIPLLGALFRNTSTTDDRTELMVLLTPRVIRNVQDARDIAKDLRRRFRHLAPIPVRDSKLMPKLKKAKGS